MLGIIRGVPESVCQIGSEPEGRVCAEFIYGWQGAVIPRIGAAKERRDSMKLRFW